MTNVMTTEEKKARNKANVRRWLQMREAEPRARYSIDRSEPEDLPEGNPKDYVHWLEEMPSLTQVVIVSRVSRGFQKKSLGGQVLEVADVCWGEGIKIEGIISYVGNGNIHKLAADDSSFRYAVALAKRSGSAILVMSTDRAIRPQDYRPSQGDRQPTVVDFKRLSRLLDGVKLVSVLRPDAQYRELQSAKRSRGLRRASDRTRKERKAELRQLIEERIAAGEERSLYKWHDFTKACGFDQSFSTVRRIVLEVKKLVFQNAKQASKAKKRMTRRNTGSNAKTAGSKTGKEVNNTPYPTHTPFRTHIRSPSPTDSDDDFPLTDYEEDTLWLDAFDL